MKRILLCLIGSLLFIIIMQTKAADIEITPRFLEALVKVESGGHADAIGDGGKALGILQIHKCVVDDVNRIRGESWKHVDVYQPDVAFWICRWYLEHYCTEKRLGRKPTLEDAARIWNGGPNGYKKQATVKYWEKVKRNL